MIYRIDFEHFLSHAIDHFTLKDLREMQYAILSSVIANNQKCENVVKIGSLYPTPDIVLTWDNTHDKSVLKKMLYQMYDGLDDKGHSYNKHSNFMHNSLYNVFINPLLYHYNIMIVCKEFENPYVDVLCQYLKEKFEIEVIDLNVLFTKGKIDSIYIDRKEIYDKAVDIRRNAAKENIESMKSTSEGKEKLIGMMTKKKKLKELNKFGININDVNKNNIDSLLLEAWIASEDDL